MKCPVDADVELVMSERQGVEIDYCPTCRGIWLDRGELDKILDRAAPAAAPAVTRLGGNGTAGAAAGAARSRILSSSPRSSQIPRQVGQ